MPRIATAHSVAKRRGRRSNRSGASQQRSWTRSQGGDSLLHIGGPIDHDVRCAMCGAFLYSVVQSGKRVHVAFGSLEDRPSRLRDAHIFVGSKADWFEINDELPQHEGFP